MNTYGLSSESPTSLVYDHLPLEKLMVEFSRLRRCNVHRVIWMVIFRGRSSQETSKYDMSLVDLLRFANREPGFVSTLSGLILRNRLSLTGLTYLASAIYSLQTYLQAGQNCHLKGACDHNKEKLVPRFYSELYVLISRFIFTGWYISSFV